MRSSCQLRRWLAAHSLALRGLQVESQLWLVLETQSTELVSSLTQAGVPCPVRDVCFDSEAGLALHLRDGTTTYTGQPKHTSTNKTLPGWTAQVPFA